MFRWPFPDRIAHKLDNGITKILLNSVIDRVDQYAGNLFYRGVSPAEINKMGYSSLKYWNGWHELFAKTKKSILDELDK